MKRILIILPLALILHAASAQDSRTLDRAQQGSQFVPAPDWNRGTGSWRRLRDDADRLNAMADSVSSRMRRFGASRSYWRRYSDIQSSISRINYRVRNKTGDRNRVSRDIQNARYELHRLELDLHFRPRDYYRW